MNVHHIKYVIEGLPEDGGHAQLSDFVTGLQKFMAVLFAQDRESSRTSRPSHVYRVVNLSHSSPATVEVEATPIESQAVDGGFVFRDVSALLRDIVRGRPDVQVETPLLNHLRDLASPVGKRVQRIAITIDDSVFEINECFKESIELLTRAERSWPGFYRGVLEFLNIHHSNRIFKIYPDIGPTSIKCIFPDAMLDDAVRAVGAYVEVTGIVSANVTSRYPYRIMVESIDTLPSDETAPSIMDLFGVAPGLDLGQG